MNVDNIREQPGVDAPVDGYVKPEQAQSPPVRAELVTDSDYRRMCTDGDLKYGINLNDWYRNFVTLCHMCTLVLAVRDVETEARLGRLEGPDGFPRTDRRRVYVNTPPLPISCVHRTQDDLVSDFCLGECRSCGGCALYSTHCVRVGSDLAWGCPSSSRQGDSFAVVAPDRTLRSVRIVQPGNSSLQPSLVVDDPLPGSTVSVDLCESGFEFKDSHYRERASTPIAATRGVQALASAPNSPTSDSTKSCASEDRGHGPQTESSQNGARRATGTCSQRRGPTDEEYERKHASAGFAKGHPAASDGGAGGSRTHDVGAGGEPGVRSERVGTPSAHPRPSGRGSVGEDSDSEYFTGSQTYREQTAEERAKKLAEINDGLWAEKSDSQVDALVDHMGSLQAQRNVVWLTIYVPTMIGVLAGSISGLGLGLSLPVLWYSFLGGIRGFAKLAPVKFERWFGKRFYVYVSRVWEVARPLFLFSAAVAIGYWVARYYAHRRRNSRKSESVSKANADVFMEEIIKPFMKVFVGTGATLGAIKLLESMVVDYELQDTLTARYNAGRHLTARLARTLGRQAVQPVLDEIAKAQLSEVEELDAAAQGVAMEVGPKMKRMWDKARNSWVWVSDSAQALIGKSNARFVAAVEASKDVLEEAGETVNSLWARVKSHLAQYARYYSLAGGFVIGFVLGYWVYYYLEVRKLEEVLRGEANSFMLKVSEKQWKSIVRLGYIDGQNAFHHVTHGFVTSDKVVSNAHYLKEIRLVQPVLMGPDMRTYPLRMTEANETEDWAVFERPSQLKGVTPVEISNEPIMINNWVYMVRFQSIANVSNWSIRDTITPVADVRSDSFGTLNVTVQGDCGAPYFDVRDGKLVGFHYAGGATYQYAKRVTPALIMAITQPIAKRTAVGKQPAAATAKPEVVESKVKEEKKEEKQEALPNIATAAVGGAIMGASAATGNLPGVAIGALTAASGLATEVYVSKVERDAIEQMQNALELEIKYAKWCETILMDEFSGTTPMDFFDAWVAGKISPAVNDTLRKLGEDRRSKVMLKVMKYLQDVEIEQKILIDEGKVAEARFQGGQKQRRKKKKAVKSDGDKEKGDKHAVVFSKFESNEEAKAAGGRCNSKVKIWFVPAGRTKEQIQRWEEYHQGCSHVVKEMNPKLYEEHQRGKHLDDPGRYGKDCQWCAYTYLAKEAGGAIQEPLKSAGSGSAPTSGPVAPPKPGN